MTVQVDLSKPGRRYVIDAGQRYALVAGRFGVEVVRLRDGANLFAQGDDAAQMRDEVERCDGDGEAVDRVLDAYDGVLELTEEV